MYQTVVMCTVADRRKIATTCEKRRRMMHSGMNTRVRKNRL